LVDQDYVDQHVLGFPELKARAADFPLDYVEKITGVKAANISDWRRQTVGDLTSAFRFNQARQAPVLPDTNRDNFLAQYEIATFPLPAIPGADQSVPSQEPGRRPHTPESGNSQSGN